MGVRILFVSHNFYYFFLGAYAIFFLFFSKNFEKNLKKLKIAPRGPGGEGPNFFYPNFYYFVLGAHARFWNPMTTPSGRINNEPEEERKREKMPFIVATYVSACRQGQRTHSARTKSKRYSNTCSPRLENNHCNIYFAERKCSTNLSRNKS